MNRISTRAILAIALFACFASVAVIAATAQDSGSLMIDPNSGIFAGTDANGDFQAALDAAVAAAETAAGCCDIRVNYTVLSTTGQRGGFVFLNDITVTIKADW